MINIKIESTSKKDNDAAELIAQAITYMLRDNIDCNVRSDHPHYFGDDVVYGCGHDYHLDELHYDEVKHYRVYNIGKVRLKS